MGLKEERERCGLSKRDLSEASGVPLRTVQHWERNGVGRAPAENVAKAAAVLGCTVDDLLGRAGESER